MTMRAPIRKLTRLVLMIGARAVPLHIHFHRRARRYILRVKLDGTARLTIPRGGSLKQGSMFAQEQSAWIENQLIRLARQTQISLAWRPGSTIWFRGDQVTLSAHQSDCDMPLNSVSTDHSGLNLVPQAQTRTIEFADQRVAVNDIAADLRPAIEQHLRRLAETELKVRTLALAANLNIPIKRVVVRNQRSRWGSCSARGTISLNWRLIQTPPQVRDYLIIHELIHRREMNHSPQYWHCVQQAFPDYQQAELWLRRHGRQLR